MATCRLVPSRPRHFPRHNTNISTENTRLYRTLGPTPIAGGVSQPIPTNDSAAKNSKPVPGPKRHRIALGSGQITGEEQEFSPLAGRQTEYSRRPYGGTLSRGSRPGSRKVGPTSPQNNKDFLADIPPVPMQLDEEGSSHVSNLAQDPQPMLRPASSPKSPYLTNGPQRSGTGVRWKVPQLAQHPQPLSLSSPPGGVIERTPGTWGPPPRVQQSQFRPQRGVPGGVPAGQGARRPRLPIWQHQFRSQHLVLGGMQDGPGTWEARPPIHQPQFGQQHRVLGRPNTWERATIQQPKFQPQYALWFERLVGNVSRFVS